MNTIEKESLDKTGLRSDVVTLYQGGLYHLYRYKKYTDVRLVFAPEQDIAFFGGDPDNFEYPRYDLDICFFRVYEDGKPAKIEHYLKWSPAGASDDDLVFVAGHPGKTDRLNTVAHLEFLRDTVLPAAMLEAVAAARGAAATLQPAEPRERPPGQGRSVRRTRTAARPAWAGWPACKTRPSWSRKQAEEQTLPPGGRTKSRQLEGRMRRCRGTTIDAVADDLGQRSRTTTTCWNSGSAFHSELFGIARTLVRLAEEIGQAQRRPAARVPRVEPRIAQAGAVLRGADLRRPGNETARRLAEHARGDERTMAIRWFRRSWPASRPGSGPPNWSTARSSRRGRPQEAGRRPVRRRSRRRTIR